MKKAEERGKTSKDEKAQLSAPAEADRELSDTDLAKVAGGLTPEKVEASSENIRRVK